MIEGFICLVIWLGLGGWGYVVISEDASSNSPGSEVAIFIFSVIIAPVTAGGAVAILMRKRRDRRA